ncbi:DNA repair protein RecN [Taylorella equigenitalis]|uniref:DNA repair protein RecN n=1 Tax=Taylorella equigenitalis TaxID=29575 RepID=UPI0023AFF61A|nr:DNA repair protein RecN [Taylorella equigenitalis]WEE00053.1 DNA repair protein RecN [Taylorella equigenitalis]WEE01530.1 DNA repair protein RecN [Taylorella equigenitalis]WFD78067.1 DNA repair protein RecN [Taylorella equigenitalis]WFD79545.1 DNA repair protein RecN [Taylorella equigenitalis]WFD81021.1 DNA repair protein RecN [Taylorella equigenitalis]
MLISLHIRDFVIVDRADINFKNGFTVFTGETGAGKSILIDALLLTLGQRASASVVRSGCTKADISSVFSVDDELRSWLTERDFEADELILRRVIDSNSNSKAYINGVPSTLAQMKELAELLIDIHGQHAHQLLLRAQSQRNLLDTQGGHISLVHELSSAWSKWQYSLAQLEEAKSRSQNIEREIAQVQWELGEIQELAPIEGEWERINEEHTRLSNAEELIEGVARIINKLDKESDDDYKSGVYGVIDSLSQCVSILSELVSNDKSLNPILESLESARINSDEANGELRRYLENVENDPSALESVESRLRKYYDLAKKFRYQPEETFKHKSKLESKLNELQVSVDIEAIELKVSEYESKYRNIATELTKARKATATALSKDITEAMQTLAMEGGKFEVVLETLSQPTSYGMESVQFMVAGHSGTAVRPLSKVASGGELARLSLAISVIASRAKQVPTLIFDEVDSGIGGGVAEIVGKLLRQLSAEHQVLCVTHLPQVAACAHNHFEVNKENVDGGTISTIKELDANQRVEEVARMLGGVKITSTTKAHAKELIDSSSNS